jgi:DNA-directed RNA polymerase subunit F
MKLIEERPVTLVEVKSLLEKRKKDAPKTKKLEEKIKEIAVSAITATGEGAPSATAVVPEGEKPAEEKKETPGELSYEQQNTLDYAEKFAKLSTKDADELEKKLREISGLTEKQIVSIINILPKKEDELKAVVAKDKLELDEEQIKTVAKIVKEYRK